MREVRVWGGERLSTPAMVVASVGSLRCHLFKKQLHPFIL